MANDAKARQHICPLARAGGEPPQCVGDLCAWWKKRTDDRYSTCALGVVADRLDNLSYYLRTIAESS